MRNFPDEGSTMKAIPQPYTILSDGEKYYCVPAEKQDAFKVWADARCNRDEREVGDDFNDYRTDPPGALTVMLFTRPLVN
jgi:hypothetical protein